MKSKRFIPLLFLFLLSSIFANPPLYFEDLGDFPLESGQSIRDCKLGYRIYGSINSDSSNILLFPTWFAGTSEHIGALIRNYDFLDTKRFAVLSIDALGNGISSSPSNSISQPGKSFPEISIADMSKAIYQLLENLNISRVYAIIGGSMGGMQAFEFISAYPGIAGKAVIYVASPRASAYDLLRWEAARRMIELGREYEIPENEYMLPVQIAQTLHGRSPAFFACEMSPEKVPALLGELKNYSAGIFPADNFYCQSTAIIQHDISRRDNGDLELTARRIKTPLLLIVNKQDHLVAPWPTMEFARKSAAKLLLLDNTRGHLGVTYEINRVRKTIDRFLKKS